MITTKRGLRMSGFVLALSLLVLFGGSCQALAAERYKIEFSALWPASSMYVNAVYWAKMINEKFPNIEAVATYFPHPF